MGTPAGVKIGYFLSCEEYTPDELVQQAVAAERAGFEGLWISDHFHPWNDEQGQSPFVWSVIGALSQVCSPPGDHRRHVPDRAHPSRDRGAGRGDLGGDDRRSVRAGRRHR